MNDILSAEANVEIIKADNAREFNGIADSIKQYTIEPGESGAILPQYNPEELSKYYQSNSFHQRCIQTKALVTAGLGYEILASENSNANGISTPVNENLQAITTFIENNEEATGETFIEMIIKFQTDFEVFGYAFLEVTRDTENKAVHLYHIPAKTAYLLNNRTDGLPELKQTVNGKMQTFRNDEFLMINNYNPDNRYYGLPEYISSLPAILLDREMMEYNITRLQNNAIPDLIISVSGALLTRDQKETMKEFWKNNFKGAGNSGKTLLIETTAKESQIQVTEIKSTYRDGAFRLAKRECRDEIIACHGVPPILLGIKTSGSIGSGKDIIEQMKTFREIIIEPRQRRLEHLFNTFFRKELNIINAQFKLKNIEFSEQNNREN